MRILEIENLSQPVAATKGTFPIGNVPSDECGTGVATSDGLKLRCFDPDSWH